MIDYTRDDVIEALEYLLSPVCTETQFDYCDEIRAAISLLKEQEPRVMSKDEIKRVTPWDVYWIEAYNVKWMWPVAFTEEHVENVERGEVKESTGRLWDLDFYNICIGTFYDTGWRIWTSRPTPEQMRDTKWEGEEDHEA